MKEKNTLKLFLEGNLKAVNEVENKLNSYARKIGKKYYFLELNPEGIYNQMLDLFKEFAIKNQNNNKINKNYMKLFEHLFNDKMRSYLNKLLKSKYAVELFDKMLNPYMSKINRSFDALSTIFKEINYNPVIDEIILMLKNNEELNKIVKKNYNFLLGKSDELTDDKLNNLNDSILISFIETYCGLNNIKIESPNLNIPMNVDNEIRDFFNSLPDKILTREEEQELFKKIKNGDEEARKTVISHNVRLIVPFAKKYIYDPDKFLDTIQDGVLGLIKALDKFDANKGYKFSTYATYWIKSAIRRERQNNSRIIRIPAYGDDLYFKMLDFIKVYNDGYGENPSNALLAKKFGKKEKIIEDIMGTIDDLKSLDDKVNNETDSYTLGDIIADKSKSTEGYFLEEDKNEKTREILESKYIDEREKEILRLRNGFINDKVYTLDEVSDIFNMSVEGIRKIETKSLQKLRISKEVRNICNYVVISEDPKKRLERLNNAVLDKKNAFKTKSLYEEIKKETKTKKIVKSLKINEEIKPKNYCIIREYDSILYQSLIKERIIRMKLS